MYEILYEPVSNNLASLRWSFTREDIDMTRILSDTESSGDAPSVVLESP